jgi:S-adenosylmethionine synthetase
MFDMATIPTTAALLDSTEIENICIEQRSMTMRRIANWLRNNAKIFELEWETIVAYELKNLADDLDHLASIRDV